MEEVLRVGFKRSLQLKIVAMVLTVVIVVFAGMIGTISYMNRRESMVQARDLAMSRSTEFANQMKLRLDSGLEVARTLGHVLEGLVRTDEGNREMVNSILSETLKANPDFFGLWTCWEPDAFDGQDYAYAYIEGHDETGRFIPYWFKDGGEAKLVPLEGYDTSGEGDFYLVPMERGRETILEPFQYDTGDRTVTLTSLVVPMEIDGTKVGAVGVDISVESLNGINDEAKLYDTGFGRLMSTKGVVVAHPDHNRIGKPIGETVGDRGAYFLKKITSGDSWFDEAWSVSLNDTVYKAFAPVVVGDTGTPWSFGAVIEKGEVMAASDRMLYLTLAIAAVGLLLVVGAVWLVAGRIVRPLRKISEMAARAQEGDLTMTREDFGVDSEDEIGTVVDGLSAMVTSQAESVAQIDMAARAVSRISKELLELSGRTNSSVETVETGLNQTSELSESNSASIEETTAGIEEVASGAQTMAKSAADGAAAGRGAGETARSSVDKVEVVVKDLSDVERQSAESVEAMEELGAAVRDIAGFVETITGIADQTNLLALNAAIEAARAGDAGRGFAVVAEEVRKLAEESNSAAGEVAKLMEGLEANSRQSISVTEETGKVITDIATRAKEAGADLKDSLEKISTFVEAIDSVAAISQEQAASSQEMASAMDQITMGTTKIAESVREMSESAGEAREAAHSVAEMAKELDLQGEDLTVRIARFKVREEKAIVSR